MDASSLVQSRGGVCEINMEFDKCSIITSGEFTKLPALLPLTLGLGRSMRDTGPVFGGVLLLVPVVGADDSDKGVLGIYKQFHFNVTKSI